MPSFHFRKVCSLECRVKNCRQIKNTYRFSAVGVAAEVRYRSTEKGRQTSRRNSARTAQTEQGKQRIAAWWRSEAGKTSAAKYGASEQGRLVKKQAVIKYRASDKGKEAIARHNAKWRTGLTPTNYLALKYTLANLVCYGCGVPAKQIDHVLAIGLARIFGLLSVVDEYAAPICIECHKDKTRQDRLDIFRLAALPREVT